MTDPFGSYRDNFVMKYNAAPVGVQTISGTIPISIFPNPASQSFTIRIPETKSAVVQVYNLLGELVLPEKYVENGHKQVTVNISELPHTVYIVKVQTESGNGMGRLVVIE